MSALLASQQSVMSSDSSSSDSDTSSEAAEEEPLNQDVDPVPFCQRVDSDGTLAQESSQAIAYMWTYSRARPESTREEVFSRVLASYEATGLVVTKAACFRERHLASKSDFEREMHYHIVVETASRARWRGIARHLASGDPPMSMHCTLLGTGRSTYWTGFGYCFQPSSKKPLADLDGEHLMTAGHPDIPRRLLQSRRQDKRLRAGDVAKVVFAHKLRTLDEMHLYANRQLQAGDDRWLQLCMTTPATKLTAQLDAVWKVHEAPARLARQAMTHREVLEAAGSRSCTCGGRAAAGWERILSNNNISIDDYKRSVLNMLDKQGGKGANHYYHGVASSGKTALTRPLMALRVHSQAFAMLCRYMW